jgi:hypothetical protein
VGETWGEGNCMASLGPREVDGPSTLLPLPRDNTGRQVCVNPGSKYFARGDILQPGR